MKYCFVFLHSWLLKPFLLREETHAVKTNTCTYTEKCLFMT